MNSPRPKGRFAPSPSGPLHFGSLVAALASYLDVRARGGFWYLRIDDLDKDRIAPGSESHILSALEKLGFTWDGAIQRQSNCLTRYHRALTHLLSKGAAFRCGCTRKEITHAGKPGLEGPIYPGTCRNGIPQGRPARSVRIRVPDKEIRFRDELQGKISQNLANAIGDFVVWRADGIPAYQLAVVVDDAQYGINRVVRGADLLASTPRQILLHRLLQLPAPSYVHVPIATINGIKLGKQQGAAALDLRKPVSSLINALEFLNQPAPIELREAKPVEILNWGIKHWDPHSLRGIRRKNAALLG